MTISQALKLLGNKFKRIIIENKHYQHIVTYENIHLNDVILSKTILDAKFLIFSPGQDARDIKLICEF